MVENTYCFLDYVVCNFITDTFGYEFSMMMSEIRESHRAFLDRILVPKEQYNPLPILSRAVNGLHLPIQIQQPCWSRNRWKSLT